MTDLAYVNRLRSPPDEVDKVLLEVLDRIAPVFVPLRHFDDPVDHRLLALRDRKLVTCQSSWEFLVVDALTEAGRKAIAR